MIQLPLLEMSLRTRRTAEGSQVWDKVRRSWVSLTPEEHVRQLLLYYLLEKHSFPAALIAVERAVSFRHVNLRFDIAIYHRENTLPWMLVECKAPETDIDDSVLQQLLQYHSKLPGCRYWLLTNGRQTFCADAADPLKVRWLDALPAY